MQDLETRGLAVVEVPDRQGATTLGRAIDTAHSGKATVVLTELRGLPAETVRRYRSTLSAFSRLGHHPAVARVSRVVELRGAIAVVVQPVDGTLRDRLRADGCLPVREALDVAVQLCGALASLHRSGVVHGDLRPTTVALDIRGQAVVLPPSPFPALGAPARRAELGPGAPPELLDGKGATPRSDVHLVGSTLYELLTGRSAFPPDPGRRAAPPLCGPGVPEGLDPLLAGMTNEDPGSRPPTAEVVGRLLQQVQRRAGLGLTPLVVVDPAADSSCPGGPWPEPGGSGADGGADGAAGGTADGAAGDAALDATFVPDAAEPAGEERGSALA